MTPMESFVEEREFAEPRLAALYDRLYPLAPAERDFYLPMMLAAPAVLDAGCGTGALLKEARRAGHAGRLCGLDRAAAMLAQARRRPDIEWTLGDLTALPFEHEFDLIVMTGHAFQALLTDEALRAALAAVRRALKVAGGFVFDTRNPGARAWERWTARHAARIEDPRDGTVQVTPEVVVPYDGRTVVFVQTYSCASWDAPLVSRSALRFLASAELGRFLHAAGFAIEAQFGDFARSPPAPASPQIITIAR